jgi:RNA polymerase sigma-70 factor, ECF subfamily
MMTGREKSTLESIPPDKKALKDLYDAHALELFSFARRLLGDANLADDVIQETFIRVYQSKQQKPSRAYLFRAAHNISLNLIRSQKKLRALPELEDSNDPVRQASRKELQETVSAALQSLLPEHRSVIVLRYYHSLKLQDIAEILSCTERTTRNRLRAAAVILERELRERGLVPEEVQG